MNHKRICAPPMGTFKWGNGKSKAKLDKKKNNLQLFEYKRVSQSQPSAWQKQSESCLQKREVERYPTAAKKNSGISEKVFAVFRNTAVFKNISVFKTIYKHCCKMVHNGMKVELLETPPKGQSQTGRMKQAYLFLKSCSISAPFIPRAENQGAIATAQERTEGYLSSQKLFRSAQSLKTAFKLFFSLWLFTITN